ncbi:aspartate kinase [Candidatus Oscillochloris fontis]|uniref:aspartate kinase n=1 Tax=Candidatus Oscillochloris fontis TaxID=2496868 RepID=UPI00101D070B|nr:aspartate kinase [Candidatus Oscillochloris fontis]
MRVVMKFGGTSVGSADAIRQVAAIVNESRQDHEVVVVVSAMNAPDLRTTDTLIAAAHAAAQGDGNATAHVAPRLLDLHMRAAAELAPPAACAALEPEIRTMLDYLSNLSRSIAVLGELTPRALDLFSGLGERLNARLIATALRAAGVPAEAIDATELIITDDRYGAASPLMEETTERTRKRLLPLLEAGVVPVVTGFIGATRAGVPTTLGRGGSDYSCSILGSCLDANEVWFWKEVDGVLTANPKVVPEARSLRVLSYSEMAELAYYGANVLHPKTVLPLVQRNIPIRIRNTFNPTHPGTLIGEGRGDRTARAVTAIKEVSMITVGGPGMLGLSGVAARIFTAVARAKANILLISQASSEQSVCLAVPLAETSAAVAELRKELESEFSAHNVEHIEVKDSVMIIAVVGSGMRGTPGIAGQVFGAMGEAKINVIAIAQGSTENNISLVVSATDGDAAVRAIHRSFAL